MRETLRTIVSKSPVFWSLPRAEAFILLRLAEHGKPDGTDIFPGLGRLARMCFYSERWTRKNLRRLEGKHLIETTCTAGGRGYTTKYTICLNTLYPQNEATPINDPFLDGLPNDENEVDLPDWVEPSIEQQFAKAHRILNERLAQRQELIRYGQPVPAGLENMIQFSQRRVDELEAQLASVPQLGAERAQ